MKKIPKEIIELVELRKIVLSGKAQNQKNRGEFETDDLVNSILEGQLIKKERDETKQAKYKFSIVGPSQSGKLLYSCGKIVKVIDRIYYIITSHGAE